MGKPRCCAAGRRMPREILPQRRHTIRDSTEWAGQKVFVEAGFGNDGRVLECFFRGGGRVGSEVDSALDDSAILVSLGLQHGCPLSVIVAGVGRDPAGKATSMIGAAIDALAKIVSEEKLR